ICNGNASGATAGSVRRNGKWRPVKQEMDGDARRSRQCRMAHLEAQAQEQGNAPVRIQAVRQSAHGCTSWGVFGGGRDVWRDRCPAVQSGARHLRDAEARQTGGVFCDATATVRNVGAFVCEGGRNGSAWRSVYV